MYDMGRAFYLAADMVARLDPEMIGIVLLSFRVSLTASVAAFLLGLPLADSAG
jgi:ABC-type tungstate transport system substrate-binding protein